MGLVNPDPFPDMIVVVVGVVDRSCERQLMKVEICRGYLYG